MSKLDFSEDENIRFLYEKSIEARKMAVPLMRFFFSSDIKDFTKDDGCDARCGFCSGCLVVFSFVVVAVIAFLSGLFVYKSETSCSLLLVALVEIWFALSMLLFVVLKKICGCFD